MINKWDIHYLVIRKRVTLNKIYISVGCGECLSLLDFYDKNKNYVFYAIDPSIVY